MTGELGGPHALKLDTEIEAQPAGDAICPANNSPSTVATNRLGDLSFEEGIHKLDFGPDRSLEPANKRVRLLNADLFQCSKPGFIDALSEPKVTEVKLEIPETPIPRLPPPTRLLMSKMPPSVSSTTPSGRCSPTPWPATRTSELGSSSISLTWQEFEITGYEIDGSDDDGEGINGIGFQPTPAIAYARSEKRRHQVMEWKAREAREARQKRNERRHNVRVGEDLAPYGLNHGATHPERPRRSVRFA